MEAFLHCLRGELKTIKDSLNNKASMGMSSDEIQAFGAANECHICGEALDEDKVREH